jgi:uncharacterized membrane protein
VSGPATPVTRPALPDAAYQRMTLVLRAGVSAAVLVLLVALLAYLLAHPGATSAEALASNPILGFLSLGGLASGLASGSREAYLTLGLLLLVATPILRVASGLYYFARAGERTIAAVIAVVLVLLLFGILVAGPYLR